MRVRIFDDPVGFWENAKPFLVAKEAEHNLLIGLVQSAIAYPERYRGGLLGATVEDSGRCIGAALCTPSFPAVISDWPAGHLSILVDALGARFMPVSGVLGPPEAVHGFASAYSAAHPQMTLSQEKSMTVYRLDEVAFPVRLPDGMVVQGGPSDIDLASRFLSRFFESTGHASPHRIEALARGAIEEGRLFWWKTDRPVSMAVWVRETPSGMALGYVYTPTSQKRKGYASALVASVSQRALDQGKRFSVLFADKDNPVANRIYRKLGYRAVADALQMTILPMTGG